MSYKIMRKQFIEVFGEDKFNKIKERVKSAEFAPIEDVSDEEVEAMKDRLFWHDSRFEDIQEVQEEVAPECLRQYDKLWGIWRRTKNKRIYNKIDKKLLDFNFKYRPIDR